MGSDTRRSFVVSAAILPTKLRRVSLPMKFLPPYLVNPAYFFSS